MTDEETPISNIEGKFNIALAYLLSINDLLREINNISLRTSKQKVSADYLSLGDGQHLKLKLVRNFLIQVSPIVKESKKIIPIWERIKKVKVKFKDAKSNSVAKSSQLIPDYTLDIENELDEIILSIQSELQELKYLMPTKSESSLF